MTLVLTLVLSAVALTALCWGLALTLQGQLYNQPADQLPQRAAVAGLAVACMLTGWTYLNTRASHKDKYGTLFEFTPSTTKEVDEFDAVRRLLIKDEKGQPKEETHAFKWHAAGGQGRFLEVGTGREFKLNTASYMTVAVEVPDGDGKARFTARLEGGGYARGDERRFDEEGGPRSIDGKDPRRMAVPSTGALVAAVAVNVGHFVVWFLAFWVVLRFNVGHALLLTGLFGTVSLFILMPLLFQMNQPKPLPPVPPPVPQVPQ